MKFQVWFIFHNTCRYSVSLFFFLFFAHIFLNVELEIKPQTCRNLFALIKISVSATNFNMTFELLDLVLLYHMCVPYGKNFSNMPKYDL